MKKIIGFLFIVAISSNLYLAPSSQENTANELEEISITLQTIEPILFQYDLLDETILQEIKHSISTFISTYYSLIKNYKKHPTLETQKKIESVEKTLIDIYSCLKNIETILKTHILEPMPSHSQNLQQAITQLATLIHQANDLLTQPSSTRTDEQGPEKSILPWILGTTAALIIIYIGKKIISHLTSESIPPRRTRSPQQRKTTPPPTKHIPTQQTSFRPQPPKRKPQPPTKLPSQYPIAFH